MNNEDESLTINRYEDKIDKDVAQHAVHHEDLWRIHSGCVWEKCFRQKRQNKKDRLSFSLNEMRWMFSQHRLNFHFGTLCLQVKRTWCAMMSVCYDSTWEPVRRPTAPNTQVSLAVLSACSLRWIIQSLEMMDGCPKFRSDIMKSERCLMCQDTTSKPSVYL